MTGWAETVAAVRDVYVALGVSARLAWASCGLVGRMHRLGEGVLGRRGVSWRILNDRRSGRRRVATAVLNWGRWRLFYGYSHLGLMRSVCIGPLVVSWDLHGRRRVRRWFQGLA